MSMRPCYRNLLLAGMASGLLTLSSCGDGGEELKLPPGTGAMPEAWTELTGLMGRFMSLTTEESKPENLWAFWKDTAAELKQAGLLELIIDHGFIYDEFNSNGVSGELTEKARKFDLVKDRLEQAIFKKTGIPESELTNARSTGGFLRAAWDKYTKPANAPQP